MSKDKDSKPNFSSTEGGLAHLKKEYSLSPVHYINDDLSIEAGSFKSANDVFQEYVYPQSEFHKDPPTTETISLRVPTHLHNVIKGNALCLGLNKTQFIIRALEVGINSIHQKFEEHNMKLTSTDY